MMENIEKGPHYGREPIQTKGLFWKTGTTKKEGNFLRVDKVNEEIQEGNSDGVIPHGQDSPAA